MDSGVKPTSSANTAASWKSHCNNSIAVMPRRSCGRVTERGEVGDACGLSLFIAIRGGVLLGGH